jgi:Tfp pilus assembly protein PilV
MGVMRQNTTREDGFLLVEVMVSAVVLLIIAMATLSLIDRSGKQTGADRSRGVATTLAQGDQDRLRALKPSDLANWATKTNTKVVDGVTYTIVSEVDPTKNASASGGQSLCAAVGTATADYYRLKSTVTWPNMNTIAPVELATIRSTGIADPTKGSVTLQLTTEAGQGVSGAAVTAGALSATTNSSGCVSFSGLSPGALTVSWAKFGYVDWNGVGNPSKGTTVVANQNQSLAAAYDLAASMDVTFVGTDGVSPAATWSSASIYNGKPVTRTTTTGTQNTTITSPDSYPFSSGYTAFAGNCQGNNPQNAAYTPSFTSLPAAGAAVAGPGAKNVPVLGYLRKVTVPLLTGAFLSQKVKFYPATGSWTFTPGAPAVTAMSGCTETLPVSYPTSPAAAVVAYLPWGTWNYCIDGKATSGSTVAHTQYKALDNVPKDPWSTMQVPLTPAAQDKAALTLSGACA